MDSSRTTPDSAILRPDADGNDGSQRAIRDAIRDAIVDRRLMPGTKLTETDVGALFHVSRTLVRGALQALAHEGLVTVERNRGAFVANPSPGEARQIFATRRIIEPGILAEAARHITPAHIRQLRERLLDEGRLMNERGQSARRAEIKASGDFHLHIAAMTGNAVMQRFMDELIARSSLVIALYGQSTVSSCGHTEHMNIVDAIEAGQIDRASRLMVHHIHHIEADLDLRARRTHELRDALLP
ncbi:GntR family transcriptional regulator [Rhizobium sp. Leaf384]|uniref:GntR family transcriptional regulator n=1 Tax=Rhizobium sp. Leaf383 TaxID=1736357 RepID=UPI000713F649|nr:GntR family transcriptional regulator [Rhizobium sp. Leaf383]KQS79630.1 GntR family transcriptional regulator [Rhizobium sp. Leaf384]KQS85136.1 GntR family transcriptional regulator [Rhizobium sp. Leaf383]